MFERETRLQQQLWIFCFFFIKIIRLLLNPRRLVKRYTEKMKDFFDPAPAAVSLTRDASSYYAIPPVYDLSSLDIIIVTYNCKDNIDACVRSIFSSDFRCPFQVHIWDNASTDGTRQRLRLLKAEFSDIVIFESGRNLGFGKAINQVCLHLNKEWVLLLNPDCVLHQHTLTKLSAAAGILWPTGVAAYEARQSPFEHPHFYDPVSLSTEWASAACLLINRQAFELVGGFDENIFLYAEDVDLSWRMQLSGYTLRYVPDAWSPIIRFPMPCRLSQPSTSMVW